jgi:hypothetical protein
VNDQGSQLPIGLAHGYRPKRDPMTPVADENTCRTSVAARCQAALRRAKDARHVTALPILAAAALAFMLVSAQPINHDVAWTLVAGGKLLDGAAFGHEIFDFNLPWVYYVSAIAVGIARLIAITDIQALTGLIVLLSCGSALLIHRLLSAPDQANFRYPCTLSFFVVAMVAPGYDFAQREHFIFVLMAPYLVAIALRYADQRPGAPDAGLAGAMTGVAILFKPYWALLPLALEVYLTVRKRLRWTPIRPEAVLFAMACAVGLAATLLLAPNYASEMVPLGVRTYWAYDVPFNAIHVLAICVPIAFVAAPALTMALARRHTAPSFSAFAGVVLVAGLTGTAIWAGQGKFFEYQAMPVKCVALWAGLASIGYGVASRVDDRSSRRFLPHGLPATALVALVLGGGLLGLRWNSTNDAVRAQLVAIEAALRDGPVRSLFAFSTSIPPAFPLVNELGATWPVRLQCLWPLPAAVRPGPLSSELQAAIGAQLLQNVVDDLVSAPPDAVLVETSARKQALEGLKFEFLPWFSQSSKFQRLWERYELRDTVSAPNGRSFQVWRLRPI